METLLGLCMGLGLAASCGFRVFAPLLVLSIASRSELVSLSDQMAWLGSTPVIIGLSSACLFEIIAYKIPWIDHALDTIASPAAVVAGTLAAASQLGDLGPAMTWSTAAIAGGGAAAASQTMNVSARGVSTITTGGIFNPFISVVQTITSVVLSWLAIVLPMVVGVLVLIVLLCVAILFIKRRSARKNQAIALSLS